MVRDFCSFLGWFLDKNEKYKLKIPLDPNTKIIGKVQRPNMLFINDTSFNQSRSASEENTFKRVLNKYRYFTTLK